jgi:hypothetical protein
MMALPLFAETPGFAEESGVPGRHFRESRAPSPRPIQIFFRKQGIKEKGASQDTAKKCQSQDECQKNQKEGGAKRP